MATPDRDPADYDSWQAWEDARRRDGKMPVIAKPVPYAFVGALLILVSTWMIVDYVGGTLQDEVIRSGTAQVTGECHKPLGDHYQCPAQISWGESRTVWSTEPITGEVAVEERMSFETQHRGRASTNEPQVWAADHTPEPRPWLLPVAYGAAGIISLVVFAVVIIVGSRFAKRRSQQNWAGARRAAGRSVGEA